MTMNEKRLVVFVQEDVSVDIQSKSNSQSSNNTRKKVVPVKSYFQFSTAFILIDNRNKHGFMTFY